jgi:hypothetical protein
MQLIGYYFRDRNESVIFVIKSLELELETEHQPLSKKFLLREGRRTGEHSFFYVDFFVESAETEAEHESERDAIFSIGYSGKQRSNMFSNNVVFVWRVDRDNSIRDKESRNRDGIGHGLWVVSFLLRGGRQAGEHNVLVFLSLESVEKIVVFVVKSLELETGQKIGSEWWYFCFVERGEAGGRT